MGDLGAGRAGSGARPEDVPDVIQRGFPAWIEARLAPRESEDGTTSGGTAHLLPFL